MLAMADDRVLAKCARLLMTVAAIPLAGCEHETPNIAPDYVLSLAGGKGVVIGSITSPQPYGIYWLRWRTVARGADGHFEFASRDPSFDASLITAELPAGDYEIYSWRILCCGDLEIVPAVQFSIPFHVATGEAVYI